MARASRGVAVIRELARLIQALMASDAGLLCALTMLFIVSAFIGLWVGLSLSAW